MLFVCLLAVLSAVAYGQGPCIYESMGYQLNLTSVSHWTLEYEGDHAFYYYTPCRNGITCMQGNAQFMANTAQYTPGVNQCDHYLSVDHHEAAQYSFIGGSWRFAYSDGETCDQTQEPRTTTIYYHCNNVNNQLPVLLETVNEPNPCEYVYSIASTLACVPADDHNKHCQWRVPKENNDGYYYLDLSAYQGETIHGDMGNGYEMYYSVCQNSLHCWQQHQQSVMSVIENRETGTCEHSLAVWEEGQVQPLYHDEDRGVHWTFHYWNGQVCSDGTQGEERIRFFCDRDVDKYKVLGAGAEGDCHFFLNISTKAACDDNEQLWVDAKSLY